MTDDRQSADEQARAFAKLRADYLAMPHAEMMDVAEKYLKRNFISKDFQAMVSNAVEWWKAGKSPSEKERNAVAGCLAYVDAKDDAARATGDATP